MSSMSDPRVSNGMSGSSPIGCWPETIIVPPTSDEKVAGSPRVERHVGVSADRVLARDVHRPAGLGREGGGVAVRLDEVGVLHDVPVAAALEVVGLPVHRVLGAQPAEHLVVLHALEALGDVEIDAFDRAGFHLVLLRRVWPGYLTR